MGAPLIKVSVCYFVAGVLLGMFMGISEQFQYTSAHAHINLLGWLSSAVAGILYFLVPVVGNNKLARVHFWLYLTGVPVLCLAMIFFGSGNKGLGVPLSAVGGTLVTAGVIVFAVNVLLNLKPPARSS